VNFRKPPPGKFRNLSCGKKNGLGKSESI